MLYIAHRINTLAQLRQVPRHYGIEVDLRDRGQRLILQHDPFADGEDFERLLCEYRHRLIVLNIKSERIEPPVLELLRKYRVRDYFFLDCSFPMMRWLIAQGEHRIAVRFSEFEPAEMAIALAGQVEWLWTDCFTRMPFDPVTYERLRRAFKICVVSPELQGRSCEQITSYCAQLRPYPVDAVCTKRPDLWLTAQANQPLARCA